MGNSLESLVAWLSRVGARLGLVMAIIATVGCDRITKHAAVAALAGAPAQSYLADTIRLEYVENTGGFLGMGANWPDRVRTAVFAIGTGFMLLLVIVAAAVFRFQGSSLFGTALVIAGGVSNWLDRVFRGSVIDFINVGIGPLRTGIFNVADLAILVGVSVLLFRPTNRFRLS